MSKKKLAACAFILLIGILLNVLVVLYETPASEKTVTMRVGWNSDEGGDMEMFYLNKKQNMPEDFKAAQSQKAAYVDIKEEKILEYQFPADTTYVRLDLGTRASKTYISFINLYYEEKMLEVPDELLGRIELEQQAEWSKNDDGGIIVETQDGDPYIVLSTEGWNLEELTEETADASEIVVKVLICVMLDVMLLIFLRFAGKILSLPRELFQNRKLIMNLAKNDFKTRFAGSYLGIIWAFIQPIVTVLVYWFVFEKGLKAGGMNTKAGIEVPFVLWLLAGLVPWFFFQEALSGGTNAMIDYSYLVKKVVFKISILPIVKIISALFVHLFFIAFTVILYAGYRYYPDLYTLQIFYYSFSMMIFVLGLVYATSAIIVFFRDLSQVINIILQVGMWMTPIMWNIDTMELSSVLITIFKLNPMYYIVAGYRDALINKVWFWEQPQFTVYFWIVTLLLFGLGTVIFKRLKVHFADVL